MTPDAKGDPLRPAHQKVLEKKQTRADHVVAVLPICHCIVDIGKKAITRDRFEEDTPQMPFYKPS